MDGIDSTRRRHQFKKKRQKTLVRQLSYAKEDNNNYAINLVITFLLFKMFKQLSSLIL